MKIQNCNITFLECQFALSKSIILQSLEFYKDAVVSDKSSYFLGEKRFYEWLMSLDLCQLICMINEIKYLIETEFLDGTTKLLIAAAATKYGWDGESVM